MLYICTPNSSTSISCLDTVDTSLRDTSGSGFWTWTHFAKENVGTTYFSVIGSLGSEILKVTKNQEGTLEIKLIFLGGGWVEFRSARLSFGQT